MRIIDNLQILLLAEVHIGLKQNVYDENFKSKVKFWSMDVVFCNEPLKLEIQWIQYNLLSMMLPHQLQHWNQDRWKNRKKKESFFRHFKMKQTQVFVWNSEQKESKKSTMHNCSQLFSMQHSYECEYVEIESISSYILSWWNTIRLWTSILDPKWTMNSEIDLIKYIERLHVTFVLFLRISKKYSVELTCFV